MKKGDTMNKVNVFDDLVFFVVFLSVFAFFFALV